MPLGVIAQGSNSRQSCVVPLSDSSEDEEAGQVADLGEGPSTEIAPEPSPPDHGQCPATAPLSDSGDQVPLTPAE